MNWWLSGSRRLVHVALLVLVWTEVPPVLVVQALKLWAEVDVD